ncbi:MAG: type IV secretory system conjugative DNA transfer family protein, partial [Pseudomonadota bacterium]|nr:type IV secretory system conjugative DNA transfer family protein [Pseudomonadota bacterium]
MANRILLLAIVGAILVIPTYIGIVSAFIMYYGDAYMAAAYNPSYLLAQYWALFQYWLQYHDRLPQDFTMKLIGPPGIGVFSTLVLFYLARAPLLDFRPFKPKESVHGDAHWASETEIRRAKLRSKKGLLLGRTGVNNYLICDDFQHILLFAPTGSGKGVGFVIPNLLFWQESVVCHDIKMENHELTSGYRKKIGQEVFLWNPADPDGVSHCYNPLDWISTKPGQMVDDVQKICNLILPEQEFWQNEARSLMLGVILYL